MTGDDEILGKVRGLPGVIRAEFLQPADRERLPELTTPQAADNQGMREVLGRDQVICLFKDRTFRPPPEPTLLLLDSNNVVVGREILNDSDVRNPENRRTVFLGRKFVLYVTPGTAGPHRFVLPPVRFPELEGLPRVHRTVSASPDPPQDDYLRRRLDVPFGMELASILVGFDRRNA